MTDHAARLAQEMDTLPKHRAVFYRAEIEVLVTRLLQNDADLRMIEQAQALAGAKAEAHVARLTAQVTDLIKLEAAYREQEVTTRRRLANILVGNDATWEVITDLAQQATENLDRLQAEVAAQQAQIKKLEDAAEMLWVVLANVSGGDWTQQSAEWQEVAGRWRDVYFAALRAAGEAP